MVRKAGGGEEGGGGRKKDRKCGTKGMKIGNEEEYKVDFLNLARSKNKDREFWESLREWDIIFIKRGYRRKDGRG